MAEEPTPEALRATLDRLTPILGRWRGQGEGSYPTIDSFEYNEELHFELHDEYPMLFYEQKTRLTNGEASHWETGFVRPVDAGIVELSNSQDSGRVEVLRGEIPERSNPLVFRLRSVHHGHDPRMVETEREFRVDADRLEYEVRMATHTTPAPVMTVHLRSRLTRA